MGRKKKRAAVDPLSRIFCYYCDRTFQTEQMLLMHQREKHLRCPTCHKRMLSIPSMAVHSSQMHNAPVTKVPNAIPGRDDISVDVLGMKGIPDEYYASLNPGPAAKNARTTAPVAASAPYDAYAAQGGYGLQNGAGTYPAAYPPQSYPQTAHPPNMYPQPAYPQNAYLPTAYPQSTYPPTTYPPAGYPPAPAMQYQQTYIHGQAPYAYPHQQPYPPVQSHYLQPVHNQRPAPAQTVPPTQPGPQALVTAGIPKIGAKEDGKIYDVKIVFDRLDCSVEELRAKLPRYSKPS